MRVEAHKEKHDATSEQLIQHMELQAQELDTHAETKAKLDEALLVHEAERGHFSEQIETLSAQHDAEREV